MYIPTVHTFTLHPLPSLYYTFVQVSYMYIRDYNQGVYLIGRGG